MVRNNKQRIQAILSLICLVILSFGAPESAQAQAGTPYEVLAEINGYRATNGLEPLAENQYLNIAAQNHASWMATTGTYSHTGINGSSATDRALAVGYGEGSSVYVTENWARGPGMTPTEVVYQSWATSSIHNSQMLTTSYYEFGAGVALDGDGMTVYVVKFGRVVGDSAPVQSTSVPSGPTNTPAPIIQPVTTAEPNPDGSVIHVVQYGQTLWAIAEAYDIPLQDLLAQNDLTEESEIYPDEELLIIPGSGEVEVEEEEVEEVEEGEEAGDEAALEETSASNSILTAQEQPTSTPSPTVISEAAPISMSPTPTETANTTKNFVANIFSGDTLWVGIGLVAVSVFGIVLLFFTSARLK